MKTQIFQCRSFSADCACRRILQNYNSNKIRETKIREVTKRRERNRHEELNIYHVETSPYEKVFPQFYTAIYAFST